MLCFLAWQSNLEKFFFVLFFFFEKTTTSQKKLSKKYCHAKNPIMQEIFLRGIGEQRCGNVGQKTKQHKWGKGREKQREKPLEKSWRCFRQPRFFSFFSFRNLCKSCVFCFALLTQKNNNNTFCLSPNQNLFFLFLTASCLIFAHQQVVRKVFLVWTDAKWLKRHLTCII